MLFESLSKPDKKLNKKITVVLTLPDLIKKRVIFNNIEMEHVRAGSQGYNLLCQKPDFWFFPQFLKVLVTFN